MNKQLAFAGIAVKSYDEELREFEGVATHVSADKVKDVVEPSGAQFSLPLPFLSKHKHESPVGKILWTKVEKDGIRVRGKLPHVAEPGLFKDRVDEAWHELKYLGDTMGLSIGFSPIEYDILPSGGVHFKKWRWDELSLVTVPCNGKATISAIKSAYAAEETGIASSGTSPASGAESATSAPVEGKKTTVVTLAPAKGKETMRLAESLKSYEDTLAAKKAERTQVLQKSLDEGRTMDAAEQEAFDTAADEIKSLEAHIARVKSAIADDVASAKAVDGSTEQKGVESRQRVEPLLVSSVKTAENGTAMAQLLRIKYMAQGNPFAAMQFAESMKGSIDQRVYNTVKAAVPAANTQNAPWAGNLIASGGVIGDFVEYLRKQTILGKFGVGNVPGLRSVPFDVDLKSQLTGGQGYWVGEGKAKPLTQWTYGSQKLLPLKVATIAAITEELLKRATPQADSMIRDELVNALRERLDTDFIDPAKAAVAGISPASITNGVTPIPSTGDLDQDVAAVLGAFMAGNNAPTGGVWILGSMTALGASQMKSITGERLNSGLTMFGGELAGFPVIVSDYVAPETAIFVNASDIYFGDEGGFQVDMSREASLEMADNPAHNSTTPTGATSMVSMWQTNSVAFRAERYLNWAKRRPVAVVVLSGVKWGQPPVTP